MLLAPERLRDALAPLGFLFSTADIAVANYESSTGDASRFLPRDISLAAPPAWLAAAASSFRAVTVANNHACDLGRRGLEATLAAARDAGIIAIGGDEKRPWEPRTLVEKDGRRVCAVAWTTFVNADGHACSGSGKLALAGLDREGERAIGRALARARASGCAATVAIFHGGKEYETQRWSGLVHARVAADAGADAVVIHHPHVPSPVRVYVARDGRAVPIFESVGNLVSNQGESYRSSYPPVSPQRLVSLNGWTRLGVIADLEWAWPAGADHAVRPSFSYGFHLTWTDNEHATNRATAMPHIAVRLLDPIEDLALIGKLKTDRDGPTDLFDDVCWMDRHGSPCVPAGTRGEGAASM
jgi:poly-gamma-glutamate synthesis protein (capsule biosynthesis protein)